MIVQPAGTDFIDIRVKFILFASRHEVQKSPICRKVTQIMVWIMFPADQFYIRAERHSTARPAR